MNWSAAGGGTKGFRATLPARAPTGSRSKSMMLNSRGFEEWKTVCWNPIAYGVWLARRTLNALASETVSARGVEHSDARSSQPSGTSYHELWCDGCNAYHAEEELWFSDNGDEDNPRWRAECREGWIVLED